MGNRALSRCESTFSFFDVTTTIIITEWHCRQQRTKPMAMSATLPSISWRANPSPFTSRRFSSLLFSYQKSKSISNEQSQSSITISTEQSQSSQVPDRRQKQHHQFFSSLACKSKCNDCSNNEQRAFQAPSKTWNQHPWPRVDTPAQRTTVTNRARKNHPHNVMSTLQSQHHTLL